MKKEIIAFITSDGLSRMCRKPIEKFATWGLRALIGSLIAAAAGLDDPRLVLRDLLQRISNHSDVVEADAGKYRTRRILHNIRRIQLSAQPCFKNHQVAVHFLKI